MHARVSKGLGLLGFLHLQIATISPLPMCEIVVFSMSTGESILLPCIYSLFSALSLHYSMHTRVKLNKENR